MSSDCIEALNLILRDSIIDHPFQEVILEARELNHRNWFLIFNFTFRKANEVANIFVSYSHDLEYPFWTSNHLPPCCRKVVNDEIVIRVA